MCYFHVYLHICETHVHSCTGSAIFGISHPKFVHIYIYIYTYINIYIYICMYDVQLSVQNFRNGGIRKKWLPGGT